MNEIAIFLSFIAIIVIVIIGTIINVLRVKNKSNRRKPIVKNHADRSIDTEKNVTDNNNLKSRC